MLNLDEINKEILMLETTRDTTYASIQRLAPLYIVRNNLMRNSEADKPKATNVDKNGGTPFMQAINGKDFTRVLSVLDEFVTTLEVLNPKLYAAVMRKIAEI